MYPRGSVSDLDDDDDDTGEGESTVAASPHALVDAGAASSVGELAPESLRAVGTSPDSGAAGTGAAGTGAGTGARGLPTSAAAALERTDLGRMRKFHAFGIIAPLGAILLSLFIGGDPMALLLFRIGAAIISASNVALVWMTGSEPRWQPRRVGALWIIATLATIPMMYYFGPFSAVVMVQLLGIVFISLGKDRSTALAVMGICIVGHAVIAIPSMLGKLPDVGLINSLQAERHQLATAEVLIFGFMISAYLLGRWARHTNATALAELESAMRVIGDQQQAIAEVKDDIERQNHANEGRWTNHTMGSFRLGLVLGRGAMGEVYEAEDDQGRLAAVKLLNARSTSMVSLVDRFHREMAVTARLVSPHIVQVFELSKPDALVPYIAMERVNGTDLASRLRTEIRLPPDELAVLLEHVGRGLEVARVAGVVHRDLKPHNLIQQHGVWKIFDFGVSKLVDSEGTLTGEGIVGTPQYMAPEQASGGDVTHLADVYSLGVIAYRCLTGRTPFRGKELAELVYQVVHTPPPRPSSLGRMSQQVEDVLAIAMAKDPRRRFPSAVAFAQTFSAARRGRAAVVEPPPNAWT